MLGVSRHYLWFTPEVMSEWTSICKPGTFSVETESGRQTHRQRDTDRETQTDRQTDRQRQTYTDRETQTDIQRLEQETGGMMKRRQKRDELQKRVSSPFSVN